MPEMCALYGSEVLWISTNKTLDASLFDGQLGVQQQAVFVG